MTITIMSRRGSSMLAQSMGDSGSSSSVDPGPLVVNSQNGGGSAAKRQSAVLQPIAGLSGMLDLDDSDYDSADEDKITPPTREKEQQKHPQAVTGIPAGSGPGGPNHRPLVGGFAAAAYEAARSDHYKKVAKMNSRRNSRSNGHRPSSHA